MTRSAFFLAPDDTAAPVGKEISDRIKIARTLCIFFMTFVHVQPGIAENVYDRDAGFFDIVYFILTRLMGLSSVSLLSIVSGYFIVSSLLKVGAIPLFVSKFKTLVVPLFAWNLLMLLLLAAYGVMSGNWRDFPELSAGGLANALFAITEWPLVVPLWFLRDLFVCCLFAPILYLGLRRAPVATLLLLVAFTLFGENLHILQRPQLMLFFGLGMWLRIGGFRGDAIDRAAGFLTIGLVVMAAIFLTIRIERILLSEMDETLRLTLDTLLRVTMAAGFWKMTELIRRSALSELFTRLEPYTFFLFCSHAILFNFAGIIFRRVFGNYGSDLFPVTFFVLPCLAVLAAVIGLGVANRSAILAFLFNAGHRLRARPAATRERVAA
ncbi:acyltransferase family protein [Arvimicrobium flavum]|uniref:acyltransferase family protein n=1 Tax=Arvimicrobium flavum TaxID=3393320 RepID=UPI00237A4BE9|nr:acyltransferase [Mesorhizobium shangrilense]